MNSMFMWDSCSWRPTEPHCHGTALLPRRDQPREEGVIVFLWRRRGWLSPPEVCREVGLGVLSRPLRGRGPPCRRPVERGERDEPVGRAGHGGHLVPAKLPPSCTRRWGCGPGSGRAAVLPMPSSTISVLSRRFRSTDRPVSLSASLTADPTDTPAVNERRDAKHRGCPRGGNHSDDLRDHVPDVGCDVNVERWTGKWHADHPGGRKRLC
jgi:hypothetical protein